MAKFFTKSIPAKKQVCYACNGSGHYDVKGGPKCSSCKGTGLNDR